MMAALSFCVAADVSAWVRVLLLVVFVVAAWFCALKPSNAVQFRV